MSIDFIFVSSKKFVIKAKKDVDVDESISKKFRIEIDFELSSNDLIYYTKNDIRRLCIFNFVKIKIFRLIHDVNAHVDVHRNFNKITNTFYISRLFKKFRRYVKHCFNCQITQIKRHRFYDELMFITSFFYSFHIIIINFILILFDELNAMFIDTNKYFRRFVFIVDKFIYNVNQ